MVIGLFFLVVFLNDEKSLSQLALSPEGLKTPAVSPAKISASNNSANYVKDEVVLKFNPKVSDLEKAKIISKYGKARSLRTRSEVYVVKITSKLSVEKVIEKLRKNPEIKWVQPNYFWHFSILYFLTPTATCINKIK